MRKKIISKNPVDTKKIAEEFACSLRSGKKQATLVCLSGDLGAGKTAFTQSAAKALGIKKRLSSPTFVIMRRYSLKNKFYKQLFHIDAYRLKNEKEILALGWEKMLADPENLIFLEWPENILKSIPKKHHEIHIEHKGEKTRAFNINRIFT